jgi:lipoprotein-anchoring transpeptidase ErfK/SrfK
MPLPQIALRLSFLALFALLSACGPQPTVVSMRENPMYPSIQDGEFFIPAVDPRYLFAANLRTEVPYAGPDAPGTIVVDIFARRLYLVHADGTATRYAIAVGREGLAFKGDAKIGRKQEWPSWQPTRNMIRSRPDLYADFASGLPGGLENPLGARALYLYRGSRDTLFRIHGTIDPASIGRATSAGCIRLFNQDAIHLFDQIEIGTPVRVRTYEESVAIEGHWIDDEYGRIAAVPPDLSLEEAKAMVAARAAKLPPISEAELANPNQDNRNLSGVSG